MTTDNIILLLEKGFTKTEIEEMEAREAAVKVPEIEPEPEPVADPEPQEPETEKTEPEPENNEQLDEIKKAIKELTKTIQASNIRTASMETTEVDDVNKMLASFINPIGDGK